MSAQSLTREVGLSLDRVRAPRGGVWTTPRLVRASLITVVVAALLFGGLTAFGLRDLRQSIGTIGSEEVSSILVALELRALLADVDSNAANDLLSGETSGLLSRAVIEERRRMISARLVAMGEDVHFGDEEREPVVRLVDQFTYYIKQNGRAQELNRLGRGEEARRIYREATQLMYEALLPTADHIVQLNMRHLQTTYAQHGRAHDQYWQAIIIIGGLMLGVLIATQIILVRRMRRVLNPPLMGATVLTIIALFWLGTAMAAEREALRRAKEDAFDTVVELWQTRALAFNANGYESLSLLFPDDREFYQSQFEQTMNQVLSRPVDSVALAAYGENQGFPKDISGALANAARGNEVADERAAIGWALLQHWLYMDIDRRIRVLTGLGQHEEAIALCVGLNPGELRWAFEQFDRALTGTLDVNRREYEEQIQTSRLILDRSWWVGPILAGLVIALAWLGLMPRLGEYAQSSLR